MKNYCFALICLIGLAACKKDSDVTEISGQVRNLHNQAPLDSAQVTLYQVSPSGMMEPLKQTITDASGSYQLNLTKQEGTFRIYIYRRGYRYSPDLTNKFLTLDLPDYQEIVSSGQKQHFNFDLAPEATLFIRIRNIPPMWEEDELKLQIGKSTGSQPSLTKNFKGMTNMDLLAGIVDGSTNVPIKYEVRDNGVWHTVYDSVNVQPLKITDYELQY